MISRPTRSLLLASAAAILSLTPDLLAAAPQPAPFGMDAETPTPATARMVGRLAHLPANRDQLMLRGERASRSFSVNLSRSAAEQTAVFQLAFKNTITLLPPRSSLEVTVNGHSLAVLQPHAADAVSVVPITIPRGVLNAGANQVEIAATMAHRVDCSIAATYELWTAIDPAQTGFKIPDPDFGSVRGLRDIASEALAADGTTRIVVRSLSPLDEAAIARAGRFVSALVANSGLTRPAVEIGNVSGDGPGIDVILAAGQDSDRALDGFRQIGREGDVVIARSPSTGRLAIILAATDPAALDAKVTVFADEASEASQRDAAELKAGSRQTFANLGLRTESFAGRHYAASMNVVLPSDFFSADHENVHVLLDAVYTGNLDVGSGLTFSVNGAVASSLSLASDHGGTLQHRSVDLPMRLFHPGHNELSIDAALPAPADRQCDASSVPATPRLILSDTSELEVPRYTHLATLPHLPSALAHFAASDQPVHLYLPASDERSVSSALSLLANMATQGYRAARLLVHIGPLNEGAVPGIVVAPWSALPADLARNLRVGIMSDTVPFASASGNHKPVDSGNPNPASNHIEERAMEETAAPVQIVALQGVFDQVKALLMRQGFTYGVKAEAGSITLTPRSLLLASIDVAPEALRIPGLDLPRFAVDSSQWLVVTGADGAVIRSGLDRMTTDGRWRDLEGQAISLDNTDGSFASMQPKRVAYALPDRLVLSDMRPILGGIMSSSFMMSLVIMLLFMSILGISTHALVRRTKAR